MLSLFQTPIRKLRTSLYAPLLLFCSFSLDSGCGTWSGNPPDKKEEDPTTTEGTVSLSIHGSGAALALVTKSVPVTDKKGIVSGQLTLSTAKMSLAEIKLKLDGNDSEERQNFKGPYLVDLVNDQVLPSLETVTLSSGTYRDIKLSIHKLEKGEVSGTSSTDPLLDNSIYLAGQYTPTGGTAVAVTIAVELSEELSLAKANGNNKGIAVVGGAEAPVIIAFRMEKWFNFSGQEHDFSDFAGGAISINDKASEAGKKLQDLIKENIKKSANFGEDKDKSGKLEKTEDDEDDNDSEPDNESGSEDKNESESGD